MSESPASVIPAIEVSESDDLAEWLGANTGQATEIWTILYKKSSGKQTVTPAQLLEAAICYGWIDVKTKTVDEQRYGIRFVPRKPGGNWTPENRRLARALREAGRMKPGGLASLPADFD